MPDRVWSWVSTHEEVDDRVRRASRLAGSRLRAVRYFDIDYDRRSLAPQARGPREVVDEQEWVRPTWAYPDCDIMDYGLELETHSGRIFSVTWDMLGEHEGLGIDEVPFIGSALTFDAQAAVWEVSRRSRWRELIDQEIVAAEPDYCPWDAAGGFWCSRISVRFRAMDVALLLAQAGPGGNLEPSADNVAVLFGPTGLPPWESNSV